MCDVWLYQDHTFKGAQCKNQIDLIFKQIVNRWIGWVPLLWAESESVYQVSRYHTWWCSLIYIKPNIQPLVKKAETKIGFWNKSCFSIEAKRRLVVASFMPVLDYGDGIYTYASSQCRHTAYHGALSSITNLKALTHHCFLLDDLTSVDSIGTF